ncbi:hypothetical protein HaLaN_12953, partial [Haematococcus lacustris]
RGPGAGSPRGPRGRRPGQQHPAGQRAGSGCWCAAGGCWRRRGTL